MSETLERRYRWLLHAYPETYRRDRGEEILSTLLEMAAPDQRRPAFRESVGLLVGGLRTRIRAGRALTARDLWLGGLRLGVIFLLLHALVRVGPDAGSLLSRWGSEPAGPTAAIVAATVLCAVAMVGFAAGRYVAALVAAAGALAAELAGSPTLKYGLTALLTINFEPLWLLVLAIPGIIAAMLLRVPGGRGWPWLLAVAPALFILPNGFDASVGLQPGVFLLFLVGCSVAAVADARLGIAGAMLGMALVSYLAYIHPWLGTGAIPMYALFAVPALAPLAGVLLGRIRSRTGETGSRPNGPIPASDKASES